MKIIKTLFILLTLLSPTFVFGETIFRSVCYRDLQVCGSYVIESDTGRISQIYIGQYGGSVDHVSDRDGMKASYEAAGISVFPLAWPAYAKVQGGLLYHSVRDTTMAAEVASTNTIPDDAWDAVTGFVYCGAGIGGCGMAISATVESFGATYWAAKGACTLGAIACIDFSRKYQKWHDKQKEKAIDAKILQSDGTPRPGNPGSPGASSGVGVGGGGMGMGGTPPSAGGGTDKGGEVTIEESYPN